MSAPRLSRISVALLLVVSSSGSPWAQEADPATYGDDYRSGDFGRVRYQENGVIITRAELESGGSDEAGLNAPIFPGDTIETGSIQRIEVQLASGSLVRLDRESRLVFLALPDPYAEPADHTVLQLAAGNLRLAAVLGDGEEFRIDTPACTVYLTGDADLRIEVDDSGQTTVFARRGVVEVVGEGGSVLVHGGMSTLVEPGELPYDAEPFNTFLNDGFDRWVENRDQAFRGPERRAGDPEVYEELPDQVRPYYGELSGHGTWIDTDEYGHVWYPSEVGSDWRPYSDGYWDYGPGGYFWVSHEPWGWAPYHYGRWTWLGGRGWCWVPGHVFAGAWVAWSWGPTYVGWSALDYWGYPAYHSTLYYDYYDPFAWTFIGYAHFGDHHCSRYRVPFDTVGNLHHNAIVTRPPRVAPDDLVASADTRGRVVRDLQENGRHRVPPATARADRPSFRESENRVRAADARRPATASRRSTADRPSASSGTLEPRHPRSRTVEPGAQRRERGATTRLVPGSAGPGQDDPARTTDRVRSIYRQMSEPRETRPRPKEPERSADSPPPSEHSRPRPQGQASPRQGGSTSGEGTQKAEPRKRPARSRERAAGQEVSVPPRVHSTGGIVRSSPRVATSRPAVADRTAPRSPSVRSRDAARDLPAAPRREVHAPSASRTAPPPRATRDPAVHRSAPAPAPRASSPPASGQRPGPVASPPPPSPRSAPGGGQPSARPSGRSSQPSAPPAQRGGGGARRSRGRG